MSQTTRTLPPHTLRHVMLAAAVGSALEWYDFFIYGTAAALVFGELFFPKYDATVGTLAAFATFAVGFIARPFGGLFFGHFGDRMGRKPMLVATILLVGGGTFLIGLLPTYAAIGIWAPILLMLMRLMQGFGAGAEYGGAFVMAVEFAPPGRRGLYGSFAPIGVTVGNLLAAGVFYLVTMLSKDQLLAWGWRIPFLVSFLLLGLGVYIRLRVGETPVFTEATAKRPPLQLSRVRGAAPASSQFPRGDRRALRRERAWLPVHGVRPQLRHQHAARVAGSGDQRRHARQLRRDFHRAVLLLAVGQDRPPARLHVRRAVLGGVCVPLLPDGGNAEIRR